MQKLDCVDCPLIYCICEVLCPFPIFCTLHFEMCMCQVLCKLLNIMLTPREAAVGTLRF